MLGIWKGPKVGEESERTGPTKEAQRGEEEEAGRGPKGCPGGWRGGVQNQLPHKLPLLAHPHREGIQCPAPEENGREKKESEKMQMRIP